MTSPTLHSFCHVGCLLTHSRTFTHTQNLGEDLLWTNRPTNWPTTATDQRSEPLRWSDGWGLVALVCSGGRTLSHVVRPVALGSDDLNFKWGTTGPFKVSRPLVGKKQIFVRRQNKVDGDTWTIAAPKFLRALLKIKMPSRWPRWPWTCSHWSWWSWWDTTHSCSGDDF